MLTVVVKVLRHFPHPEEEAELVGQLVRGWCAFEGAPEEVWRSMGDDREGVEEMRGSALEVSLTQSPLTPFKDGYVGCRVSPTYHTFSLPRRL